jgi:very-short-patch-repair endonuclease
MTINTEVSPDNRGESHPWRLVAEMAAAQHGVIASWQLLERGFSPKWIERQLGAGRFHRIHRGVYAVGHKRLTRQGHWMAAALACGPTAVVSHRTAAALHTVLRPRDGWPHVTVPAVGRPKRHGIVLHQVNAIPATERGTISRIPVTSLARTLLDLAHVKDPLLPYAIDEAADNEILDVKAIHALEGRRGIGALRKAIADYEPTPHWTRSNLEKRFYKLMRKHGIPLPAVNQWIEGYEVDMVWVDEKVIVEIDSDLHDRPSARRKDPLRDAKLQLAGYIVYRVPGTQLILRSHEVAETVNDMLTRTAARPTR